MAFHSRKFNNDDLISILALSKDATAIYNSEDLVIEMANDAMISFWGKDRKVIGQTFPEAVPELIGQPFFDILRDVWRTGITYEAKDTAAQLMVDGRLQWFYYDFIYRAIKNENGEVYCILHTATDVSALHNNVLLMMESQKREQNLTEELSASNEELADANKKLVQSQESLLNINYDLEERISARITELSESEKQKQFIINMLPASVLVIRGPELIVELINKSNLDYWNKTKEEVIGKPFLEVLPDLADQPFAGQLRQVIATGQIVDVKESRVLFENEDGTIRETFVDYTYQPLTDISGNRTGVLVMSFEVTDRVAARKLLEQYTQELQAVNEELSAANEEMVITQHQLQETVTDLAHSESRFKFVIQGAPVAIGVLNGKEFVIESANDMILKIWGKSKNVIGMRLEDALPELQGQPFLGLLKNVYTSGEPFYGNEALAKLEHNGELKDIYLNFVYQPILSESGQANDIIAVATDVTEQVQARRKVERTEESLRMAVDAAAMGTFHINVKDRTFIASPKLKEFFGYLPDEEMPYNAAVDQVHPDYKKFVAENLEAAFAQGIRFDMEHPVVGRHDGKIRWVRAIGERQHGDDGEFITGVLHDITEKKLDELRKNDFIGMVSHELKTPLTSLNAYLQMLQLRAIKAEDTFTHNSLDQSLKQVKRMSIMINGFLNISRLESGKINIDKKIFDMAILVKESETETVPMYPSHNIVYEPVEETFVHADREKILQVITNLISNAVKYSKSGSTVQVACVTIDGFAQVSVKDEGLGIKKEELGRIFERYYRVENHTNISGFGIGLYLTSEIIERHEGQVWAQSEPGIGSTFYFRLPVVAGG